MSLGKRTLDQYRGVAESLLTARPPLPRNMMVELSNACNHACVFCPNPYMERRIGRINNGLLHRIIEEAGANGVKEIGFYTTGDPFVHKALAEFTAHAKSCGFEYTYISTNGALATPERARAVIDAGMDSIKFSINAGSRETYKFIHGRDDWDVVVENLKFISVYRNTNASRLKLYVTCVVTEPIKKEIEQIKRMFEPIVDEIWFDNVTPLAWPDKDRYENPEICNMPFNRLHVTYEGYLTLCCVDFENYLAVADLNKSSLSEAWHSEPFANIRRKHLENRLSGTLCGRCWHGDKTLVTPLNEEFADVFDYEEYDRKQHQRVLEELRIKHGKPVTAS